MVSSYLQKSDSGSYHYDIHLALSRDHGRTWDSTYVLNQDGINAEHGFVSMQYVTDRGLQIAWLDGRNTKVTDSLTGRPGAMSIRTALLDENGAVLEENALDLRVCDCCQTDITSTDQGPLIVYRDRSQQEIRDIRGMRYRQGKWYPLNLPADGWEIKGCPVNGPRVAAKGKKVVLAWFTAAENQPRVQWATSENRGDTFSQPLRVDGGNPIGRVDVVLLEDQSSLVSWMEQGDGGSQLMALHLDCDGQQIGRYTLTAIGEERSSGFPQMTAHGYQIIWAWTDSKQRTLKSAYLQLTPQS